MAVTKARFKFNEYGEVYVGRVLRDAYGELREVTSVLYPEDLHYFTDGGQYRGSNAERCALYGTTARDPGLKRNRKVGA